MAMTFSMWAPVGFDIKSSNLPLVALVLRTTDLNRLNIELQQRFGDMPGFWLDHRPPPCLWSLPRRTCLWSGNDS
jgi:septum site-determining protein MinC